MPFLFEGFVKSQCFLSLRSTNKNRFLRGARVFSFFAAIALFALNTSCTIKANNEARLAALKAGGPEISQFDVPSTKLQAGSSLNIPFSVTPAAYTDLSMLTLQFASDGVNFVDVAPVDITSSVIVWNVPKAELANARLQLTAVSSMGKSSSKQSSSFSTSLNPLNSSLFAVSSSNPTGSTSASFTISDCSNRISVYASESKTTPLGTEKSWMTCSTTPGSIPFTLSSKEGVHTVYFWTQDKDQNISDPVSVNVTLDKTGPTLAFTNAPLSSSSVTGGSIYALGFTAKDLVSGVANIKVQYSSDNGATFSDLTTLAATVTSYNWTVPTAAVSSAKLKIVGQDAAGNSSSLVSPSFTIILTPPSVSIESPLASTYANSSNYTSLQVSGSCSAQGGSVAVTASDGASHTATASTTCNLLSSPNWSLSLNLSSLNNGSVDLSAVHTNLASISTTSSTVTITKDSINPTVSITSPTVLNPVNVSNVSSLSVTGSCSENGRGVTVSATDGTNTVSAMPTCNTAGSPQFSTSLNLAGLLDGNVTISATQSDVAGNTGSATTVAVTKDVALPTVASVSTSSSSGTYLVGSTVSIQVAFSKGVNVTGTPQITVATGAVSTSRTANYTSGTGTSTLTFTYTVQNGDYSTQLNYLGTTSLALNGGTIFDSASNNATLTLPATGSSFSLAGTSTTAGKTIKINTATLAQSTVTTSLGAGTCTTASSCKKTQTTHIVLTTKDSSSNPMTLGGLSVSFSASTGAGVSTGTIGSVTDNGDGTYQATFTATGSGTATTITATISGLGAVTSTTSIVVTNVAPVITPLATKTYPLDGGAPPAIQGNSVTLATATDADNDTITLSCTYKTLGLHTSDPNYAAAGTNCSNLDTITSSGSPATTVAGKLTPTTTGAFSWTPTYTQRGTFQFTINGTDGVANAASQTVTVAVRAAYTNTNLLSALDALNATNASGLSASTPSAPFTSADAAGSCLNLLSSASNGSLTFGTTNPWGGTGQSSTSSVDPYALTFNKNNSDSLSLGTVMNTATQFSTETWVKPSPLPSSSPAPIIVGNGGGTGNGFVLRQSQITPDRAEFVIGKKYYSYQDLVLSDKPVGYWRLGETSGATATDLTAYGNNGTYTGTYTLGQTGAISGDTNKSLNLDGSTAYVNIPHTSSIDPTAAWTLEAWVMRSATGVQHSILEKYDSAVGYGNYAMRISSTDKLQGIVNSGTSYQYCTGTTSLAAGTWYHVAVTYLASSNTVICYVNGVAEHTMSSLSISPTSSTVSLKIGARGNDAATKFNGYVDDAAIYNYPLTSTQITEHYQTGVNGNYKAYPGNAILADKPVGYWRLGEKSGLTAYDISGNRNDGTYNGGYTLNQTGAINSSIDDNSSANFNGTSGYVSVPDNTNLQPGSSDFTVEAWVKLTSATANYVAVGKYAGTGTNYWLGTTLGKATFSVGDPTGHPAVSSSTMNDGNFHHLVGVRANGTISIYSDGIFQASVSGVGSTSPTGILGIGKFGSGGLFYWPGAIDEVAFYNYPISATQITSHYNSGNGPGWWTCQSQTQLSPSNWNFLSTLYDGTIAKLFVNGQQECSVTPGTTYSGTVANTVVGSNPGRTSSFWQGLISSLRIFGTSNATPPESATTIKANFDSEANRYRSTPIENIVTSGLMFYLDAANAKQGLTPYSNGCASSDMGWFDLSPSSNNATLFNFSSCGATTGWNGDGTILSPYRLTFNGTSNYVVTSAVGPTTAYTKMAWINWSGGASSSNIISSSYATSNALFITSSKLSAGHNGAWTSTQDPTVFPSGSWHHVAVTYDSTVNGGTLTLYRDGVLVSGPVGSIAAPNGGGTNLIRVGANSTGNLMIGSIAVAQVYNTALTLQQIKQNCIAQEKRFTNTQYGICSQP